MNPIQVFASQGSPVACAAIAFRHRAQLRVAVVAKATFTLVPGGLARLDPQCAGAPLAASDLVPFRPRVDVTFTGRAHAPRDARGDSRLSVRLAVFRERAVIDKTLPAQPGTAPGLGPIALDPAARARLLQIPSPIVEIADAFDWSTLQAAPPDQQMDALRGGEWIVLDNLHPSLPRLTTCLPGAVIVGRVQRARVADGGGEVLTLVPDTLAIDGERLTCDIAWRGAFAVPGGEAELAQTSVVVGFGAPATPRRSLATTRAASGGAATAAPFPLAAPGSARQAAPEIAGAPWAATPAAPVPRITNPLAGTAIVLDKPAVLPPPRSAAAPAAAPPAPAPVAVAAAIHARRRGANDTRPPSLPLREPLYGRPRAKGP